ncbi:MAG: hypothetical protein WDO74_15825 [Pseudomonadota bacterium]
MTTTAVVEQSRVPFFGIAIVLVILSGCSAPESEEVVPITADATAHRCRGASRWNLLTNPGFDANVSGWNAEPGASIDWASGFDALGCPGSGSAAVVADASARVYQCIPVAASSKYSFGLRASRGVFCEVNTFSQADCAGQDDGVQSQAAWINVDWSPDLGSGSNPADHSLLAFTTTPTDKSARVSCYSYFESQDANEPFNIDTLYVARWPGGY